MTDQFVPTATLPTPAVATLPTLPTVTTGTATDYTYGELRGGSGGSGAAPVRARSFEIGGLAVVPPGLLEPALEQARSSGYAIGWAQGMRDAAAQTAADIATSAAAAHRSFVEDAQRREIALRALAGAATQLEVAAAPISAELQDLILGAAVEIAEALVRRELRTAGTAMDAVRKVLDLAPVGESVTVRLAPGDFAALAADGSGRHDIDGRPVTLVSDPELAVGDSIAVCGASIVDGRLALALARIRAELTQ